MPSKLEDLLTNEAKETRDKEASERGEELARKGLIRALDNGRDIAEAADIRAVLDEEKTKKRVGSSIISHIAAFLSILLFFEVIMIISVIVLINEYFSPIIVENATAIGALFAAAITTGGALSIAFYRFILRDRL